MTKFVADYTVSVKSKQNCVVLNARQFFELMDDYSDDDIQGIVAEEARDAICGSIEYMRSTDLNVDDAEVTINKVTKL